MVNPELLQYNEDDIKLADRYSSSRVVLYFKRDHFRNKRIPKYLSAPIRYTARTITLPRPQVRKRDEELVIYQCRVKSDKAEIIKSLEKEAKDLFPEYTNNINIKLYE